jgi:hypothetical protein
MTYQNPNYLKASRDWEGQKAVQWVDHLLFCLKNKNIADSHKFMEKYGFWPPQKRNSETIRSSVNENSLGTPFREDIPWLFQPITKS